MLCQIPCQIREYSFTFGDIAQDCETLDQIWEYWGKFWVRGLSLEAFVLG